MASECSTRHRSEQPERLKAGERMRTIKRTEITVETRQAMVIRRRGSLIQSWCARCGEPAGLLRLQEGTPAGVSPQAVSRQVEADRLHLVEIAEGLNYICLNSLLK